jgi:GxxExxY protein
MVTGTKEVPGKVQRTWNGGAGGGAAPAIRAVRPNGVPQGVTAHAAQAAAPTARPPAAGGSAENPRGEAVAPAKAVEPMVQQPAAAMTPMDKLLQRIIGCAIEVHRHLGPGLPEASYEAALCRELELAGLRYRSRMVFPALYKGSKVGEYRVAILVEDEVIVEPRCVERVEAVHEGLLLALMRAAQRKAGLFLNFNSRLLKEGMRKFVF